MCTLEPYSGLKHLYILLITRVTIELIISGKQLPNTETLDIFVFQQRRAPKVDDPFEFFNNNNKREFQFFREKNIIQVGPG